MLDGVAPHRSETDMRATRPAPYTPRHMAGIAPERAAGIMRERLLAAGLVACLAGAGVAGTWTLLLVLLHTLAYRG